MCKIYETLYACNHRSQRPVPCVKTLCEREASCPAFVVPENKPRLCRLCIQVYSYVGPIILAGQTAPITTPELASLPFPHSFTSSKQLTVQRDLNRSPALIVGLKDGKRHPDNEYIATMEVVEKLQISQIKIVQGRYWRHIVCVKDIKEEELLPFAAESFALRNRNAFYARAFDHYNATEILQGIVGAALISSKALSRRELPIVEACAFTCLSDLERSSTRAAMEVCERYPPKFVRFLDGADRLLAQSVCCRYLEEGEGEELAQEYDPLDSPRSSPRVHPRKHREEDDEEVSEQESLDSPKIGLPPPLG
ncbi:MAG: hypothetical protein Q9160_008245 [Pyrenula sp. 1 TL-2023]